MHLGNEAKLTGIQVIRLNINGQGHATDSPRLHSALIFRQVAGGLSHLESIGHGVNELGLDNLVGLTDTSAVF